MIGGAPRRVSPPGRRLPTLAVLPQRPSGGAPPAGLTEFFRFRFAPTSIEGHGDTVFPLFIEPLGEEPRDEAWYTAGSVSGGRSADIRFTESRFYLAAHQQIELPGGHHIDEIAYEAYRRLLNFARRRGYPNLLRIWNLFPGINAGGGDQERYRQFSLGRALAFDALGYRERKLPAGTAIGTDPGTPLTISLLAGKTPCRTVENPRQTSAYSYPRQFGPRSPSFSRAVLLELDGAYQLLISGTASIVGHESRHGDRVDQQITEIFRNIRALIEHAAVQANSEGGRFESRETCFRLYLRRREDLPAARDALAASFGSQKQILFLRGDICRRELVLEIEGACSF